MKTKIKTYVGTALVACSLSFNSCTDLSEKIYDTMSPDIYQFTPEDAQALFVPVYNSLYATTEDTPATYLSILTTYSQFFLNPIFRDFRAIFGVFRIE